MLVLITWSDSHWLCTNIDANSTWKQNAKGKWCDVGGFKTEWSYHISCFSVSRLLWKWGRRWKREGCGGQWVWKQDWVRLIVACRKQLLSSPNIIIRFSIILQPLYSVAASPLCSCSTRCNMFLQFNLATRPWGGFTYCLDPRTNQSPANIRAWTAVGVARGSGV